jgi:hypothetical protein
MWLAAAREWIEEEVAALGLRRTGPVHQPHVRASSTVLRVPTNAGDVWFKANVEALRHEAALVGFLATRRPDCVPPLLAADVRRGWMLMADGGACLRDLVAEERRLDRWLDVLPRYATLQLDVAGDVHELLDLGVPDLGLSTLTERYERLLEDIGAEPRFLATVPRVSDYCAELSGYDITASIQHDDLHDGQVFVRDGQYLVLDWGDACVSHPFFTLAVTLEGGLAWGIDDVEFSHETQRYRDAYLAPYCDAYDAELADLVDACAVATRLGWVCRAVNGHVPGRDEQTFARLRMFLDGRP